MSAAHPVRFSLPRIMSTRSAPDAAAAAAAIINEHGVRSTPARVAVLATLLAAHEALTHHDVEERLQRGHDIDRGTR